MTTCVNISNMDKKELLYQLWLNNNPTESFNNNAAYEAIQNDFIDYFCGVPIKVTFYDDGNMRTDLYNRDTKGNSAEIVIQRLKQNNEVRFNESTPMTQRLKVANDLCADLF